MPEDPQVPDDDDRPPTPFSFGAPGGMPGFPEGIDLNAIMRMLRSPGPINWEVARQVAVTVALGENADLMPMPGGPIPTDPPIAAAHIDALQGLTEIARTQVAGASGITEILQTPVHVIGRGAWAELHLDALHPVLEAFGVQLGTALQPPTGPDEPFGAGDVGPFGALAGMLPMIGPLLLGMQAGSMVGELANHALGRYDLPLPTSDTPSIVFCAPNLDAFINDWSLDERDARFHVALFETVRAAIRQVPWVQVRLIDLATQYVSAYELDPERMRGAFGDIDHDALAAGIFDPSAMDESAFAGFATDPQALLSAMRSPRQEGILRELQALCAVLEGYADTVVSHIGRPLIPDFERIEEARRRHRIERGDADRFIEGLLGIEFTREHYEQGEQFCAGVIERAGIEGLNRLWTDAAMLPTASEIDAPGLWLARIDLPIDEG